MDDNAKLLRPSYDDIVWTLEQILDALPTKRDWLDPELEKLAKAFVRLAKKSEEKKENN